MRLLATGLLALMTLVFVVASLTERRWAAMAFVRAFSGSRHGGGMRRLVRRERPVPPPFRLPIPHTAIIPRNKDRIGDSLGGFIVENFLSPRVLDAKLHQLELAAWGGGWLQDRGNASAVADRLIAWGPALIRALPAASLEELAGSVALTAARSVPAAPTASALLTTFWNEGRIQPLVERGAELLRDYLAEHQDVILEKVQGQSWRWLPSWVDRTIARRITNGLLQLLVEVQDASHPWRVKAAEAIAGLIVRLDRDPELRRQGEALKRQLLDDPRLHDHAHTLWIELEGRLHSEWTADAYALRPRIERLVMDLGGWLANDATVQRSLNTAARTLALQVILPRREEIGRFVAQVVQGWDARSVVDRLELQVGPDLQFIRINGTIVGGLVGLAIYTLARMAGLA